MDDLNEGLVDGVGHQRDEGETKDDDVDIYKDLEEEDETMANVSDANFNVIERFNRLLEPKNQKDDFYEENASEEDVDLYDDLNTFEKQLVAEELQAKVEILEEKCSSLDSKNTDLKAELEKVNKMNLALRRNISSIFKTAKTELERKDRQLKDLQREHDTLIFRRGAANNKMLPHNVNTPPPSVNPSPACIRTAPPTKNSMLNPDYMATPSQHSATVQNFYAFKKDSDKGNLVTIDNEAECTFKMGPVTLSFMSESLDFRKRRFKRFENEPCDGKIAGLESQSSNQRVNVLSTSEQQPDTASQALPSLLEKRANLLKELSSAKDNLEEGEFTEESPVKGDKKQQEVEHQQKKKQNQNWEEGECSKETPAATADRKQQEESGEMSRRRNPTHSQGRSHTSSRSRSPIDGKRKRSLSNERGNLRSSRPHERGPPRRSPARSSRHQNLGNTHYNSRSNRRR